jgi:hypothetical protein
MFNGILLESLFYRLTLQAATRAAYQGCRETGAGQACASSRFDDIKICFDIGEWFDIQTTVPQ